MSHLIPEKRLDRNGKLVTRHVASKTPSKGAASLPAPSISKDSRFVPTAEQLVAKRVEVGGPNAIVSDALNKALRRRSRPLAFTASDVEIYGVLSVAETFDAAALLTHGIRSAEEARSWLRSNGVDYLTKSNAEFAKQALQRRIPAETYFEICMGWRRYGVPVGRVLDAAEAKTIAGEDNPVWEDVLNGSTRIEDIRKIGLERLAWCDHPRTSDYTRKFLKALNAENLELDEQRLQRLMDNGGAVYGFDKAPSLVAKLGYEKTLSFHSYGAADSMWQTLGYQNDEQTVSKITFFDDMARVSHELVKSGAELVKSGAEDRNLYWTSFQFHKASQCHDAGLTPEEAVDCHRGLTTIEQAVAIREGIVSPSVSSGWL